MPHRNVFSLPHTFPLWLLLDGFVGSCKQFIRQIILTCLIFSHLTGPSIAIEVKSSRRMRRQGLTQFTQRYPDRATPDPCDWFIQRQVPRYRKLGLYLGSLLTPNPDIVNWLAARRACCELMTTNGGIGSGYTRASASGGAFDSSSGAGRFSFSVEVPPTDSAGDIDFRCMIFGGN